MSAAALKVWLDPMLEEWRAQYVRIHNDMRVDGVQCTSWTTRAVIMRLHSDGGGVAGGLEPVLLLAYTGEARQVYHGMFGMPSMPLFVLHAKWIGCEPVKLQAEILGLKVRSYWLALDNAYHYLAGRIHQTKADLTPA